MSFAQTFHRHLAESLASLYELESKRQIIFVEPASLPPGLGIGIFDLCSAIASARQLEAIPFAHDDKHILTNGGSAAEAWIIKCAGLSNAVIESLAAQIDGRRVGLICLWGVMLDPTDSVRGNLMQAGWELLDFDPQRMQGFFDKTLQYAFDHHGFKFGPAASWRYQREGLKAVEFEARRTHDPDASLREFCETVSANWRYRDNPPNADAVFQWLLQLAKQGFEEEGRHLLKYILRYGYFSRTSVENDLRSIYESIARSEACEIMPVACQPIGKSESFFSYYLRDKRGSLGRSIKLRPISECLESLKLDGTKGVAHIVCFDDVICSGRSVIKYLRPHREAIDKGLENGALKLTIVASIAGEDGVNKIKAEFDDAAISVRAAHLVGSQHEVFSADSIILPKSSRKDEFREFCRRVGEKIYDPNNPLGWCTENGWCIVLDYTVPNMTLPIVFQRGSTTMDWWPLFERTRTAPPLASGA